MRIRRSRMLGWDRNPLRRCIDRVEAAVVAGLIAAFLWVTPSGSLTWPPLRHAQVGAHVALAEWLAVLVLGLLLCLAAGAGRVLFARRRLADWNRAWRAVEPRWTRQR